MLECVRFAAKLLTTVCITVINRRDWCVITKTTFNMYVKVRKLSAKPGEGDVIVNISKMALIQELRKLVFDEMGVEVEKQRLFYKGKQLIDDHRVMDYDIQLNDVIQLMVKIENFVAESAEEEQIDDSKDSEQEPAGLNTDEMEEKAASKYFKIGDAIDVIDLEYGAWFEAHIVDTLKKNSIEPSDKKNKEPNIIFRIQMDCEKEDTTIDVSFADIRPRSHYTYRKSELLVDQIVLVNYNVEQPSTRGYWYDFIIKKVSYRNLKGTILVGKDKTNLEDCTVKFIDEVMKIEKSVLLSHRLNDASPGSSLPAPRKNVYYCEKCKDVASKPCKECGCKICSGKSDADEIILCDECDYGYHIKCLTPPLSEVPSEPDWYCPSCKVNEDEIVKAGDKLKFSSKKAKMASAKQETSSRDWGRGMACVGRTKECTIVPKDHFGPVPGIDVGTCWKFRLQVSEAGIHRPHVAGIHGRETDGAYSLVLSGGYEDDIDNGDEFVYSGSGGRDLSGNKRISDQSSDQALTRMNKALALNCNVPLNENGAEATDWKGGKPVRVVRNYKICKHSKFGPKDGNRYDGIYKVVKYYPEKGKSGFLVWKYVLRRDDPTPAPWQKGGQELEMLYPPGFLEAQAAKGKTSESKENQRGIKRKTSSIGQSNTTKKTKKAEPFKLIEKVDKAIKADEENRKLWNECKPLLKEGKQVFLSKVEELFMCICCQEVVHLPVTTECKHNICKSCLKRSFSSEIYSCPYCRFELGKDFKMEVNENLSTVLLSFYPGYEAHR